MYYYSSITNGSDTKSDTIDNTSVTISRLQTSSEIISSREEDIYSVASDGSSIVNQVSKCTITETQENCTYDIAEFGNKIGRKNNDHTQ